jgi:hypothetical protein
MNEFALDVLETNNDPAEPTVTFILARGDEEVLRREARVFSEDDLIGVSDEITDAGGLRQTDVDQYLAELIEPIRIKWLRAQDRRPEEDAAQGPQAAVPRYVAVLPSADGGGPREASIRDVVGNRTLTNFVVTLEEDVEIQDDVQSRREFAGKLTIFDRAVPFRIGARDFADNAKLKEALFDAGGCELVIHCGMDELRKAISTLSRDNGRVRVRRRTTNFGWTQDRSAYLTPNLHIYQDGFEAPDERAELRVDLESETPACHLDMKMVEADELTRVKRHVVEDLLALSDRTVTHTLLGAAAAAVLYPFAKGAGRFALWLVGLTGSGKSFAAKLFANFFGDFPLESAAFTTWGATGNFIQRQGYFFKDALYLVDDFKPELVKYPQEVVRVLQAYADNTARGRLRSDATANVLRPIRGLLVCTGEDVPEHHASAVARSVIVRVPQQAKNVRAGARCLEECGNYSGVTADFIRWLLNDGRPERFTTRFGELRQRYYGDVAGQQNDIRVATNLALLGASFELFAEYLGDVWEGWREAARRFVEEDLVAIRDGMLGEAKEQQASEVFLRTLGELVRFDHVRIAGLIQRGAENRPLVGRVAGPRPAPGLVAPAGGEQGRLEICTSLALAEVNACLRQQGRQELRITERALLQQLREDGKLLDQNGEPLAADADPTRRVRMGAGKQLWAFTIGRRELLGEG